MAKPAAVIVPSRQQLLHHHLMLRRGTMKTEILDILECPTTRSPLKLISEDRLAADGHTYSIEDGIIRFAPGTDSHEKESGARGHYEDFGWQRDEDGAFRETKAELDMRGLSIAFTRKCITRLGKYFGQGGKYLLDVGCGPIPHKELLAYGDRYQKRICLDLSFHALEIAKAQLGDRGVYLQGDVTRLPIKTSSVDAVTCNHVVYQVPPELQAAAFKELWRVLKPGGVCVAVYWWQNAQLPRRLGRVARLLGLRGETQASGDGGERKMPATSHNQPYPRTWFDAQPWPFQYKYDTFRVVDNGFMRTYVGDDWRGRRFLDSLFALQVVAPTFCGKYGSMPAIVIRKE